MRFLEELELADDDENDDQDDEEVDTGDEDVDDGSGVPSSEVKNGAVGIGVLIGVDNGVENLEDGSPLIDGGCGGVNIGSGFLSFLILTSKGLLSSAVLCA